MGPILQSLMYDQTLANVGYGGCHPPKSDCGGLSHRGNTHLCHNALLAVRFIDYWS